MNTNATITINKKGRKWFSCSIIYKLENRSIQKDGKLLITNQLKDLKNEDTININCTLEFRINEFNPVLHEREELYVYFDSYSNEEIKLQNTKTTTEDTLPF